MPIASLVAAARPNFMKLAPLLRALDDTTIESVVVHTGQHYDEPMSGAFFDDLGIRPPDLDLGIGSGTHAEQTAGVMVAFEQHLVERRPDVVVVFGDVNSTLACALAAAKLDIPVAHVEAGLRSGDWTMPEEINRVLTDRLSTWLFTPSADADENLLAEGIPAERTHLVGNIMIDTLLRFLPTARDRFGGIGARHGLVPGAYGVLTLHRPSNVDDPQTLQALLTALGNLATDVPLLWPMHPRTRASVLDRGISIPPGILTIDPLGYLDFVAVVDRSRIVLTDSGGLQEETSVLGVPCVTIRDNTERPVTCELGTNRLAGTDGASVVAAAREALARSWEPAEIPLWDGRTGERIAELLDTALGPGR
ncbi:MAG TPA: UDP-N-acetylglucosamine 2-epimerase (non-hydrolyzing) [Acidimicrobiia bacterium]|nr:UDP-N-acetylglucosamine 2-epimerase (non-hydrolyzing) [Acidimicrobiia bacterium]